MYEGGAPVGGKLIFSSLSETTHLTFWKTKRISSFDHQWSTSLSTAEVSIKLNPTGFGCQF